jgi:membrane peptidoglycan carboxypeptidase
MQEIALGRMEAGVAREGAARGFCIITRPRTGEILALVQVPCADPDHPESWGASNLKVCPVTDCFEPGSSFKLVTFAASIEDGRFDPEEPINCLNGSRPMPGGRPITDHESYGILRAWEVLAHSSNIGTGLLAERLGPERFYKMERAFGFGLPTGIPLPGEGRGRITEPSSWSGRSLATMAFGQEVSCTALQMALAYGAVANGGNLMKPLLVRAIRAPDGSILEENEPEVVRPVLRPAAARELRELLRRVVTEGTGQKAEIEGLSPAGKTSTAQKYIPAEGTYSTRHYIGSFVGFAPYDDPQILCLVLMDEPTSSIYGGSVAAPIFREIVSDLLPFLGGERTAPSDSIPIRWARAEPELRREIPAVVGLSAAVARRIVRESGFEPRLVGGGTCVTATRPEGGEHCLPETVVTLVLGDPAGSPGTERAVMPDLRGLTLRDAWLRIRSCGGRPQVDGSGWVLTQVPTPGEPISPGQPCLISLGPDSSRAYSEYLESERRASWTASKGGLLAASPREPGPTGR